MPQPITASGGRPARLVGPGAVRTSAVWSHVHAAAADLAATLGRPLHILDLGGGTGGLAVPLAEAGHRVTVVDPSPDALAALGRRVADAGVASAVTALQGDADTLADLTSPGSFDLVCAHGVLEMVDDPTATMVAIATAVRSGGVASVLVANRLAVVVARALAGDFATAHTALTSSDGRWGAADPLPRRFDVATIEAILADAGLVSEGCHGVRIFTDLVPSHMLDSDTHRAEVLALEQAVASDPAYGFLSQIGTSLHALARRP